ncbi:tetratricopeptide repeat protein [Campylobacter sp. RM16187]|uniref:tetratricopeptide repeat protein n=1 Tax=Campylobacter sp. RM16187 TaxID=1660063 RepID=UPI0021B6A19B|nr:tetratricopeptide repeat protein [Campylobacter sp. RM16187]QKG30179.1 Sel1 domain-containing protein [Campylobacter sp. RM16187]
MKKLSLILFLVFSCLSVAQAGPNHHNGLVAISKGQWKDAEHYLQLGCYKEKNSSSCKELGQIYEFGRGSDIKKDLARSKQAYEKCCELAFGKRDDCCNKIKDKTAVSPEKGCENGDAAACIDYGYEKQDVKYYQKACDLGSNLGCLWTGYSYTEGKNGAQHDPKKGFEIFSKLCSGGYDDGCKFLAMGYRDGKGVDKNIDKAIEILSQICGGERFDGCAKLGEIYQDDKYGKKDEIKAFEYYLLAFTKKDHEASGKYVKNKDNAAKACEAKIAIGCQYAGSAYYQEKQFAKAMEYSDKGCEHGLIDSCILAGFTYYLPPDESGVTKDLDKAKIYFKKCCELGSSRCCSLLDNIK